MIVGYIDDDEDEEHWPQDVPQHDAVDDCEGEHHHITHDGGRKHGVSLLPSATAVLIGGAWVSCQTYTKTVCSVREGGER